LKNLAKFNIKSKRQTANLISPEALQKLDNITAKKLEKSQMFAICEIVWALDALNHKILDDNSHHCLPRKIVERLCDKKMHAYKPKKKNVKEIMEILPKYLNYLLKVLKEGRTLFIYANLND
jgi:hypothetical protein